MAEPSEGGSKRSLDEAGGEPEEDEATRLKRMRLQRLARFDTAGTSGTLAAVAPVAPDPSLNPPHSIKPSPPKSGAPTTAVTAKQALPSASPPSASALATVAALPRGRTRAGPALVGRLFDTLIGAPVLVITTPAEAATAAAPSLKLEGGNKLTLRCLDGADVPTLMEHLAGVECPIGSVGDAPLAAGAAAAAVAAGVAAAAKATPLREAIRQRLLVLGGDDVAYVRACAARHLAATAAAAPSALAQAFNGDAPSAAAASAVSRAAATVAVALATARLTELGG